MNQHIENAEQNLVTAEDWGISHPEQLRAMSLLSIAESLLSIAKSLHTLQLENDELIKQLKEGKNDHL
jgi:hypothetical protein